MSISFNCPKCRKKLSVPDNMAGKVAKCPCGTMLKIPVPRQPEQSSTQSVVSGQQPRSTTTKQTDSLSDSLSLTDLMSGAAIASTPLTGTQPLTGVTEGQSAVTTPALPEDIENLNPDFQVQCVQCGQKFRMKPNLFGQTVTCKCGAPIRFDDPLGSTGSLINNDPLGLNEAVDQDQPIAYQSQSRPSTAKQKVRDREEEVLKMYIKDDGLENKNPKGSKTGKRPSKPKTKSSTQYQLATPVQRLIAAVIDSLAIGLGGGVLGGLAGSAILGILTGGAVANDPNASEEVIAGLAFLGALAGSFIGIIIGWLIFSLAAMIWETFGGLSIGKLLLGLQVSRADGTVASLGTTVMRALIKFQFTYIGLLAVLTGLGILIPISGILAFVLFVGIFFVFGVSRQTFWDRLSGSSVITKK
ncbi:MAG: RDD family protein [Planctomycetota bacterium]|nr:RDD family protein [Planctomycetota bacterium]